MGRVTLTDKAVLTLGAIRVAIGDGRWTRKDFSLWSIMSGVTVSRVRAAVYSLEVSGCVEHRENTPGRFQYAVTARGNKYLPPKKTMIRMFEKLQEQRKEESMKKKSTKKTPTTKKAPAKAAAEKAPVKKTAAKAPKRVGKPLPSKKATKNAAKAEKPAAAPKTDKIEQNGIAKPTRGATFELWKMLDKLRGRKKGICDRDKYLDQAVSDGHNENTAKALFSRWRKFHGI